MGLALGNSGASLFIMTHEKDAPWWVGLTKEIGGLGLVLVMLVGLFVLGDKYLADMKETWDSIEKVTRTEVEGQKLHRETLKSFMAMQDARMTEQSRRLTELEKEVHDGGR